MSNSRLMIVYNFLKEYSNHSQNELPLVIGLPDKEFKQLKIENQAMSLNKFDDPKDFKEAIEFTFNTTFGTLRIYNNG